MTDISTSPHFVIPRELIAEFCRSRKITELAVFGSALRDDFAADSDIDLMVTFAEGVRVSLFDLFDMETHLSNLLGHPVDLVMKEAVITDPNPYRRTPILDSCQVIYESA